MRSILILFAFLAMAIPAALVGQVGISISVGPPPMPVYEQPVCPGDGYLWTPGYWAYDDSVSEYYWVDGAWVMAPEEGLLWTPGYWGWQDGGFFFNQGYWGTEVGFYGGINYGYGYFGDGYGGGRWDGGHFFYNRSVNNVNISINRNVYNTEVDHHGDNHISFNGGSGGISVHASAQQQAVAQQRHLAPVAAQTQHAQSARANPAKRSSANHGNPPAAAPAMAIGFNDKQPPAQERATEPARNQVGGVAAQPHIQAPPATPENTPRTAVHPNDLPPIARPEPANSGNAKADKKYQQQQDKLVAQQSQDREKLQQKQESQHQPNDNPARTQQLEQKHAQQTRQLSQKHEAQQQSMQARQPQAKPRK
jgi:hypothetical protein